MTKKEISGRANLIAWEIRNIKLYYSDVSVDDIPKEVTDELDIMLQELSELRSQLDKD